MLNIKAEKLTKEAFSLYGEYYEMTNPNGYSLNGELHCFYPDRVTASQGANVGYSPIIVKKPDEMVITQLEYHTTTSEMILPLNDDMIIHVSEPSAGKPITNLTKAFIVPKNTLIKLKACVWHLAPLPKAEDKLYAMIILPECTYINDCTVVDLKQDEIFKVSL